MASRRFPSREEHRGNGRSGLNSFAAEETGQERKIEDTRHTCSRPRRLQAERGPGDERTAREMSGAEPRTARENGEKREEQ